MPAGTRAIPVANHRARMAPDRDERLCLLAIITEKQADRSGLTH